ncbi:carbohydrate ABC transporter permease [Criibacterium bergeronii]|uniref:Sugar ABC transporter permease n=1 Tax=Criibacterium bergeronii TaxID=1871336 RepID=A0A371IME9_9FIRM|nr:sugar ABC transporter permease [Criibacterium bergeronii]MBS6062326.1 sugar ABC transporter permease [Peptostreptococcaceae bacterium]RDY21675.1 sugar ABC transporter permease [Criibacterium bergeronii]TRW28583.1 sugar ABC transporter permease [Criibacterium bergeronii]
MEKILKKHFLIFVLPTLLVFLVVFIVPFILGIILSFSKFTTIFNAKFVGLSNYVIAFSKGQGFSKAFAFTSVFTIVSIITVNVFAFTIALILTRKIRATNLFRSVFFMPNLIGGIVLGYTWQVMLDAILLQFGQTLLANAKYGFIGLVLLMNWQMIGYMMVIYIAGLQNVPQELIEAAKIDGADSKDTLFNVTIPMVMPSITICLFLTLANSFKLYDQNLALTAGAPLKKTQMLAMNIVDTMFSRNGFEGVGQAKAVVFFIIVAVIAYLQLRFTRDKEVEN